jgi:hypothetical protein
MTTTTSVAPSSRPSGHWLSTLSLLVAGGAVALGVVAIATDDVSDRPAQVVVDPPASVPADVVEPAAVRDGAAPVQCRGQARLEIHCIE